ncbi:hypothetical protein DSLASN_22550 [Desulfoluna limicola]|uniref:Transposase n=1 Tax=Desulfoluna limicola TaxID=2810562 RepID=A0ABM7PGA6_9BACT|nr:hypothetical protein DSLASN_22550 [Desulfoluna limicola]
MIPSTPQGLRGKGAADSLRPNYMACQHRRNNRNGVQDLFAKRFKRLVPGRDAEGIFDLKRSRWADVNFFTEKWKQETDATDHHRQGQMQEGRYLHRRMPV